MWCTNGTKSAPINRTRLCRSRLKWAETGVQRWIQLHLCHPDSRQVGRHRFFWWMVQVRPSRSDSWPKYYKITESECSLKKKNRPHTNTLADNNWEKNHFFVLSVHFSTSGAGGTAGVYFLFEWAVVPRPAAPILYSSMQLIDGA